MPTHEEICSAVRNAATSYPIQYASYFGSYARGEQRDGSDLDLLVRFNRPVSLFLIAGLSLELEEMLKVPVDVIKSPLPKETILVIDKEVPCYGFQ